MAKLNFTLMLPKILSIVPLPYSTNKSKNPMKTYLNLLTIIFCLWTLPLAFSGQSEPSPTPVAVSYYRSGEFNVSILAAGAWTQTDYKLDRYLGADHAPGAVLNAKYFLNQNIGIGLSLGGFGVKTKEGTTFNTITSNRRFVGDTIFNLTCRYPIGAIAPYVSVGGGLLYNGGLAGVTEPIGTIGKKVEFERREHQVKLVGEAVVGVEYRFSPHIGANVELAIDKVDRPQSNFGTARTGVTFAF